MRANLIFQLPFRATLRKTLTQHIKWLPFPINQIDNAKTILLSIYTSPSHASVYTDWNRGKFNFTRKYLSKSEDISARTRINHCVYHEKEERLPYRVTASYCAEYKFVIYLRHQSHRVHML